MVYLADYEGKRVLWEGSLSYVTVDHQRETLEVDAESTEARPDGEWAPYSPRSAAGSQPFPAAYVGQEGLDGEDLALWYVAHVHFDQSFPYTARGPGLRHRRLDVPGHRRAAHGSPRGEGDAVAHRDVLPRVPGVLAPRHARLM